MSRIGIQPIKVPVGVTIDIADSEIRVKGPKGELKVSYLTGIEIGMEGTDLKVARTHEGRHIRAMHGTVRSLLANAVEGAHKGFERSLEIEGVGYRVALQGRELVLNLGFSHPINFPIPDGIDIEVNGQTGLTIRGIDNQQVGQVAARIRGFSPAEPYKGKGVRYKGEHVRRKVGKAVS